MGSKFDFYEVVHVHRNRETFTEAKSCEGVVLGKSKDECGVWGYAVQIFLTNETWMIPESQLRSAGRKIAKEKIYSGSRITVPRDKLP